MFTGLDVQTLPITVTSLQMFIHHVHPITQATRPARSSPEALAGLHELCTTNPTLHAVLMQATVLDTIGANNIEEEPDLDSNVYDDCDIPLDVVLIPPPDLGRPLELQLPVITLTGLKLDYISLTLNPRFLQFFFNLGQIPDH
ncbi:hypothetical protein C8R44DRAFT_732055 [Mycena epipterygia]|nr:hypothetical protein C8R44DRAFT_732055 [Mycena epipterygia]